MPKAVRFHETGGPENLKIEEVAGRAPGPGEAKLRVEAVGLNRAESLYYRGQYVEKPELPSRIGYEAAGVVEAVGADVDQNWVGRRAATVPGFSQNRYGVLGEEAIVPAAALAAYPDRLSFAEAASVWMQFVTAWCGLVHFGGLTRGDFVVITASSSSVGLAAIQMVKDAGGVAIATTRTSAKREALASLGADHVIATEEEDVAARVKEITGGKGARIIFDSVAGPLVKELAKAAARQGVLIEYGALSLAPTPFPFFLALSKGLTMRAYMQEQVTSDAPAFAGGKQYIYDRLADGRFQPKIARTFPLAQAADAYRFLESNAQVGKVVITVR